MQELAIDDIYIENMIYEIRGKQVMFDSDLAKLYKCKNGTKTINLAVKRHLNRFPERFMFRLTEKECQMISRFQIETLKSGSGHNIKYLPNVFTEQGVAMLATVLKTDVAESVSIQIMDAFVSMRKYLSNSLLEQKYINNQVFKNAENIKLIQETLKKFEEKRKINEIFFNGQIYDAYSKILDILKEAKQKLVVIDGYADKTLLDVIREICCDVILITKNNNNYFRVNFSKYCKQYKNLKVFYDNTFHDRYFIIDYKKIYHCGTSINHAGSKTFSINLLEDEIVKKSLIEKTNNIIDRSRLK